MIFFKGYSNIKDFLSRFTILKIGKLHIRLHKIKDIDRSGFFHNHPFNYISIVLKGGYTEQVLEDNGFYEETFTAGHVIFRNRKTCHKITEVKAPTYTLFLAWGKYEWRAVNLAEPKYADGVYQRTIKDKKLWAKRKRDIWFIGHESYLEALSETRHSIHQCPTTE